MRKAVVYEVDQERLDEFKITETDVNYIFEIFGVRTMLSHIEYKDRDLFFIHVDLDDTIIKNVFITMTKRFDYDLVEMRDPRGITSYSSEITEKERGMITTKLVGMKISEVSLMEEVKGIALRVAIEGIINSGVLGDAKIEKEDGKAYLVKGGKVQELTGAGFAEKAEKFLVGKTLEEIEAISNNSKRKDHIMVKLIEGLNMIQAIKLEEEDTAII